ncbi:hypothetical protein ACRE1S_07620 [Helicobacter himalayensis]|uniref:hypothetical protein n=1 Tax=Helicobacter himalayensis TaxID=1591088 RepID=UPI003D6FEDA7
MDFISFSRSTFGFYMPLGVELSIVGKPPVREIGTLILTLARHITLPLLMKKARFMRLFI